jgi:ketosteroid isomerase-like protein
MKPSQSMVTERLQQALNAQDLEALFACFTPDFQSDQPLHPDRSFRRPEQVLKNWSIIFQDVPDFHAELIRSTVAGDTAWSEWHYSGIRRNGVQLDMRGVAILGVEADQIKWARLYIEPVQTTGKGIDTAVKSLFQ